MHPRAIEKAKEWRESISIAATSNRAILCANREATTGRNHTEGLSFVIFHASSSYSMQL